MSFRIVFIYLALNILTNCTCHTLNTVYSKSKIPQTSFGVTPWYDGDDSIYLYGGIIEKQVKVFRYSISSDNLIKYDLLNPYGPSFVSSVHKDESGNVFYFGGDREGLPEDESDFNKDLTNVFKYNVITFNSTLVATLPFNVIYSPSIVDGNDVHFVGGLFDPNKQKMLTFHMKYLNYTLHNSTVPLTSKFTAAARVDNGKAFVFSIFNRSIWKLNTNTMEMEVILGPTLPSIEDYPSAVTDGKNIYIVAAFKEPQNQAVDHDSIIKFDPETNVVSYLKVNNWPKKKFVRAPKAVYVRKLDRIYCFEGWLRNKSINDDIFYVDLNISNTRFEMLEIGVAVSIAVILIIAVAGFSLYCKFKKKNESNICHTDVPTDKEGNLDTIALLNVPTFEAKSLVNSVTLEDIIKLELLGPSLKNRDEEIPPEMKRSEILTQPILRPRPIWRSKQPLCLLSQVPLGKGSFGSVYKVQHINTRQKIALKVIDLVKAMKELGDFKLLLQETVLLSGLLHQNIVRFYNCWVESPKASLMNLENFGDRELSTSQNYKIFIQMELCDGTLVDWLQRSINNLKCAAIILKQILKGVQEMHKKNIVHRDIKPNNIFYKAESVIVWKLGDLGLSQKIGGGSSESVEKLVAVGHFAYMSPEMSNGLNYSCATDIYSLGLVFLQIVIPEISKNLSQMYKIFGRIRAAVDADGVLLNLLREHNIVVDLTSANYQLENGVYEILKGMLNVEPSIRFSAENILIMLQNL